MRKKKTALLLIALLSATACFAAGCASGGTSESSSGSSESSSSSSSTENPPDENKPEHLSVNTGFETDEEKYVIEGGNGIETSINKDKSKVLTGDQSLKMSVSMFATGEFKFSSIIDEKVIKDYDLLSFWIYSDYDGMLGLSNSAQKSPKIYIDEEIEPQKWTKISIKNGSSLFDIIQYNLSFNTFYLNAMGKDLGKVVEYDVYLDDIRLYKEGMEGECTLMLDDGAGGNTEDMPLCLTGAEYALPKVNVYSPEGYALYNADKNVKKKVFSPDGEEIEIQDGKINVDRAGEYTYDCTYVHDGIENRLTTRFEVVFASFSSPYTGRACVGENYIIPALGVYEFGTQNPLPDAKTEVTVKDPDGNPAGGGESFTPSKTGEYTITYQVTRTVNGIENVMTLDKSLYVHGVKGLIADFSCGEENMLTTSGTLVGNLSNSEKFKESKNENEQSFKVTTTGHRAAIISFTENFPYESVGENKYLSMWIYNGANIELRAELSNSTAHAVLKPQLWNLALFPRESFFEGFAGAEILLFDAVKQSPLNAEFYIDDIRMIQEGDAEEVIFSSAVTTEDYDAASGTGRRFAANYEYEIDRSLYSVSGEKLTDEAVVESVRDKRNRKIAVRDGKYFTPTVSGTHTVTLTFERDGIFNSMQKVIDVTEQMLLSPDSKFMLIPAEQNKEYTFDVLPELWNYGKLDKNIKSEISVYSPDGTEMAVTNDKFTPTKSGRYTVYFLAKDTAIASSSALLETTLVVFAEGKYGVVADFEDGNPKVMESTTYYYGEVTDISVTEKRAHSGKKSATFGSASPDTQELKFSLAEDNLAGDISKTKYLSFWIYIEDPNADNLYTLFKTGYAEWINEHDSSFVPGSLRQKIQANRWTEVRIERADYETVLGGTIFAGQTVSCGGSMWAAQNNDFITQFAVAWITDSGTYQSMDKSIQVYIDDFTLGY